MGKLLVREIDILSAKYAKVVQEQKDAYFNSAEYRELERREKLSENYLVKKRAVKELQKIDKKIKALYERQGEINEELKSKNIVKYNININSELDNHISTFKSKVIASKNFKSYQDIEAIVVMAAMEGGADIEASILRMLENT